jgi:hypothetical protein
MNRRLGRFDRLYGPHDSELPLQETHRPAFRCACCEEATVGGKRDRPIGLCSLAESHQLAEWLQQFDGTARSGRVDQDAADAFAAAIFAGVAGRQHLCRN